MISAPLSRIRKLPALALLVAVAALSAGCGREFTIDPGLWVLNAQGHQFNIEDPGFRPGNLSDQPPKPLIVDREVRVELEWVNDEEVVKIHFVSSGDEDQDRAEEAEPFLGVIDYAPADKNKKTPGKPDRLMLDVEGSDEMYRYQMQGYVISPTRVQGDFFGIEPQLKEDGIQARFTMVKKASD